MSSLLGSVVDGKALWQTVVAALVAGIGVTTIFAIALFGAARSIDHGRDGRSVASVASAALALVALAAVAGSVVLGIIAMTSKS